MLVEIPRAEYPRINRAERSGLLGNGVVPAMCTIAFDELILSLMSGDYEREYLPNGYSSIEALERAVENGSYRRSKVEAKTLDRATNWPTLLKRDYKDASNRRSTVNRISVEKGDIVRAEMTIASAIFTYYYKANSIQPLNAETMEYEAFNLNINQDWLEALMGLEVGWTQPLFGWKRSPKGHLL